MPVMVFRSVMKIFGTVLCIVPRPLNTSLPTRISKGEITPDLVRKTAGLAQIQVTEEEVSAKFCLA